MRDIAKIDEAYYRSVYVSHLSQIRHRISQIETDIIPLPIIECEIEDEGPHDPLSLPVDMQDTQYTKVSGLNQDEVDAMFQEKLTKYHETYEDLRAEKWKFDLIAKSKLKDVIEDIKIIKSGKYWI